MIGTFEPIAQGETWIDDVMLSDENGAPIALSVLNAHTWECEVKNGPCSTPVFRPAITVITDGHLRIRAESDQTRQLDQIVYRVTLEAIDSTNARERVLDMKLPITVD